ncbi:hypothetical protein B0T20DRAFT_18764 [Sordaria brevicollis]|uniref:Uncharacterized protein n=1 Tax=Sordaria brevicollis TaxID=83679 RepID=A0AAE0PNA4_SORBR|nr:hypothetical protein B0T20DRAFT_18764 [Sordaria brevicollis]
MAVLTLCRLLAARRRVGPVRSFNPVCNPTLSCCPYPRLGTKNERNIELSKLASDVKSDSGRRQKVTMPLLCKRCGFGCHC